MKLKRKEKDIQAEILTFMRLSGAFCWRVNSGMAMATYAGKRRAIRFQSITGVSDIVGVLPGGRFVAIEVKRPGEKPNPHQGAFMQSVNEQGGLAFVATCIEDVEGMLAAERLSNG